MGLLNVKPRDLAHAIDHKVKPEEIRAGKETNYWFCLDGKRRLRVTKPKVHRGSSVPPGTLNSIRQSLQLTTSEMSDLVNCPMSGSDYEALIRQKITDSQL